MCKLMPLKEFWGLGLISKALKRPLEDALRCGTVRGYKLGVAWYVDPDEVLEDLKTLGGNDGRNSTERKASALEGRLVRGRVQGRPANKKTPIQILRKPAAGRRVLAQEDAGDRRLRSGALALDPDSL